MEFLKQEIENAKLGQYRKIYAGFKYIAEHEYDLKTVNTGELECIPGVGMKTSRFFLLHSNQDFKDSIAILDTHILKFIKENIDDRAPKSTPTIKVTYKYWEDIFLYWCDRNNKNVADFDFTFNEFKVKNLLNSIYFKCGSKNQTKPN